MILPFIDNDHAPLQAVLLVKPLAGAGGGTFPNALCLAQYSLLESELQRRNITCSYIPGSADLPYQCYTRDSSIITPFGLYINQMGFSERVKETASIKDFALTEGWTIAHEARHGSLEGGDVIIVRPGLVIIGTNGLRTSLAGAAEIQEFFQHRGWVALIVTYAAGIRHLDVVLGVIDAATMVYAEGSISESEVLRLRAQGMECFAVDVSTTPFACNFVNLGNKRLLTCLLCAATKATFAQLGCTTVEVDVSAFIDDDGGPHCLIQCIARAHTKAPS